MGRLFWKFFIFIFLAQLCTTLGVGVSIWLRHQAMDNVFLEEGKPLPAEVPSSIRIAKQRFDEDGIDGLKSHIQQAEEQFGLVIFALNSEGHDLLDRVVPPKLSLPLGYEKPLHVASSASVISQDNKTYRLIEYREKLFPGPGPGLPPPNPPDQVPGIPLMPILMGFIASLIFAGILAWYLSKPIRNLRDALQSAANGRLDSRPGNAMGQRHDELADLSRYFDRMADQLHNLIQSQKRLLHDVSHEMRSPLARQQAAIDLARQQPHKTGFSMDRLEKELNRMDVLVGELLALSRLEADMQPVMDDFIQLSELLTEICDDAAFEAEPSNIIVAVDDQKDGEIQGNYELLRRAIENVIRNAVKHSPNAGTVVIRTMEGESGYIRIEICDEGKGVSETELDAIFAPFYQGRSAQKTGATGSSVDKPGYGLGLAIAKHVIEKHGGTIYARNRQDQGLCVQINLPLEPMAHG